MKNNKGLSYIELILVIAIMVLITGVTALSLNYMTRTNAVKAADKIMSEINRSRTLSLAKGTDKGEFHMVYVDGKIQVGVGEAGSLKYQVVANSPVEVVCVYKNGDMMPLDTFGAGGMSIRFEPASGKMLVGTGHTVPIQLLQISNGETIAEVVIYEETGKTELQLSTAP